MYYNARHTGASANDAPERSDAMETAKAAAGQPSAQQRYLVVPRTLSFVLHDEAVLLIKRSPHRRIFPGKINGLGGHLEREEDVWQAAAREIAEESGLAVTDLWLAGVVSVEGALGQAEPLASGELPGVLLFVFTAQAASRAVMATDEGDLLWAPLANVASLDWVDGDPGLLWQALAARRSGRPFFAYRGRSPAQPAEATEL